MAKLELMIKTNEEALAAWDADMPVWTCQMGGIGPGYEQCIHLMVFEMLRSMLAHPHPPPLDEAMSSDASIEDTALDFDPRPISEIIEERKAREKAWKDYADMIEATPNVKAMVEHVAPTGAQFGAAMNLAAVMAVQGYEKAIEMIPDGRAIMVTKNFPTFPKVS